MSNMHSLSSLAGAIWGPGHDSERCYFVAYAAYYDASGNQDHPSEPLVVVGLESSEALWSRFDAEWSEMLREFDVGHLHMKEFTSFRGEFKDWRNREPDRRQLMQKATRVLSRAVVRAFSVGIHMDEFHKVNAEYVLAEPFGNNAKDAGAYSLAGSTCAALVVVWHYAHRPEHNINHLFEKGDKGQRGLASLIDVSNLGLSDGFSIIPKKKPDGSRVRPFEGADFLAYEHRKYYMGNKRIPLDLLHDSIDVDARFFDYAALRAMCEDDPEQFPRR